MSKTWIHIIWVVAIVIATGLGLYLAHLFPLDMDNITGETKPDVASYAECVDAGGVILESYPTKCRIGEQTFTEDIGNVLEKRDIIRVDSPRPNTRISSPVQILGEARGPWYFEANFSVRIEDADGNVLANAPIQADGPWMTEDFVPFSGDISFETPQTQTGNVYLVKANASGLPEHADEVRIPVTFAAYGSDASDTATWQEYRNAEFGFSIKYPDGWELRAYPDDRIAPRFNIYKPSTLEEDVAPPFTHHSDATHVSIFPHGVPTEGVFSEQQDATISYTEPIRDATTYVLSDDTKWATIARFSSQPGSWNEPGFVWGGVQIADHTYDCYSDGEQIPNNQCDVLMGDSISHHGTVDTDTWNTVTQILETFTFTE